MLARYYLVDRAFRSAVPQGCLWNGLPVLVISFRHFLLHTTFG